MAGWKTKKNNFSTTGSELWRNAGPSALKLQVSMLKSDKIWCVYLVVNCVRLRTFWTPLACGKLGISIHSADAWPVDFSHTHGGGVSSDQAEIVKSLSRSKVKVSRSKRPLLSSTPCKLEAKSDQQLSSYMQFTYAKNTKNRLKVKG